MAKKQLLIEVEKEAKEISLKNPNTVYYVIDKRYGKPKCYSISWMAMQKINNENYYPVCTYKNGIRY